MSDRKTKIVCTIGPASDSPEMLEKLMKAGMNVVRLNFSHVTPDQYTKYAKLIKTIRTIAKKLGKNITIVQDLCGPKVRTGKLKKVPFVIKTGQEVVFTTADDYTENEIPVQWKPFSECVKPGERVLVADGKMELKVLSKKGPRVKLKVINGGEVINFKGVNIPDSEIKASPITEKDKRDLDFGLAQDIDYVAISFVSDAKAVVELKKLIAASKKTVRTMVKVERKAAIPNLEEIVQEVDSIMVARGDMGVEIPFEQVPLVQKKLIHLCNLYGKPVIVATQMLSSMVSSPVPTRAEISDVANAIFDRTDAVMLSEETAMGSYPVKAVQAMHATALEVEKHAHLGGFTWADTYLSQSDFSTTAVGFHGMQLAKDIKAKFIVVFTIGGFTALQVARFRPAIPMIVFTLSQKVKQQLSLVYGMNDVHILKTFEKKFTHTVPFLMKNYRLQKGDKLVFVSVEKELKEGAMDEVRVFTIGK